jgi:hypothetical protein
MTNIFGKPGKRELKKKLFAAAVMVLEGQGWKVERVTGAGKSSLRRITKQGGSKTVTIRTTQNTWIAFPRNKKNDGWGTLEEVDFVIATSVDNPENPKLACVHMIPGDDMRSRFDRAFAARKKADYALPLGRGIWISLYEDEANSPVTHVGAGAGNAYPPLGSVSLSKLSASSDEVDDEDGEDISVASDAAEGPLTIAEAKRRLALTFGVGVDQVSITITS